MKDSVDPLKYGQSSLIANPFRGTQTFGESLSQSCCIEPKVFRKSQKELEFEANLADKSSDELKQTHFDNMKDLDLINKRLLETLSGKLNKDEEDEMRRTFNL